MEALKKMLTLLFPVPNNCLLCGLSAGQNNICPRCREKIITRDKFLYCPVCGRYYPEGSPGKDKNRLCAECLETPPAFFMARSLGPYRGALKEAIYNYKYRGYRSLASFFGRLLAELLLNEPGFAGTDILVPVPLSQEKTDLRGFNQSALLAAKIGQILNLPVSTDLIRLRNTPSQSKLVRKARIANIKGAFTLNNHFGVRNILLIDDIFTTGATAGECARVLLESGGQSIGVLTLASGVQEKDNNLL